jgi:hypothetical protein
MRSHFLVAAALALPMSALATPGFLEFKTVAIAPDGLHIASIETRDDGSDSDMPALLMIRDLKGGAVTVPLPCAAGPDCKVDSPAWSMEGQLAFVVSRPQEGIAEIDTVDARGGAIRHVLSFNGTLDKLRYGPGNMLAVLATAQAHKLVGRTEAGAPLVGDIGSETDEQRIAVVDGEALTFVSPISMCMNSISCPTAGSWAQLRPEMATASGGWRNCTCSNNRAPAWYLRRGLANSWPHRRCRPTEKAWRSSAAG